MLAGLETGRRRIERERNRDLDRFRPIVLTMFSGIALPINVQAEFLISTAVALGFGILLASVLQMVLVPAYASLYARRQIRSARDKEPLPA